MTTENTVKVQDMDVASIDKSQAIAITVTFRRLGDSRQGDIDEVQTSADKDMARFVKKLFCASTEDADGKKSAKCKEYEAIRSFDNATYNWLISQSVALLGRRNVRLIRKDSVKTIDEALKRRLNERKLLVEAFKNVYPAIIENARTKLNGQFNATDYPSAERAAKKFDMVWDYLALGVPDNLPDDVKAEIAAKAELTWQKTAADIRDGLRIGFIQLVEHLIERLEAKGADKKNRFHDSNIGNILEFIDSLQRRNLTNDTALEAVTNQAKALIEGASPEALKDNADARKVMISEMSKVKTAMDSLISPEKRRKFDLED